jgi:hypothetical protein
MNDTRTTPERSVSPHDPAMAAPDPAMFAPMTREENLILDAHLTSGWYKQAALYPVLSEPWRETAALKADLTSAWWANFRAQHGTPERQEAEPEAPEAGS